MKKLTAAVTALLMVLGAMVFSSGSAGGIVTCDARIFGFMTLDFDDGGDGQGTGFARWNNSWIRVEIESTEFFNVSEADAAITTPDIVQVWSSPAWDHDHTMWEYTDPTPLFAGFALIDSEVLVDFGDNGDMAYSGLSSQIQGTAWFSFSGTLCDNEPIPL